MRVHAPLFMLLSTLVAFDLPAQTLVGAASRKVHAGTPRDLPIDTAATITGAVTVEPRVGDPDHTLVFRFDVPVTQPGTAAIVDAQAQPLGTATPALNPGDANEVLVTVAGVPDRRRVTVTLSGVSGNANAFPISLGFRVGDSDHSGGVTVLDVARVKAFAAQPAGAANFALDVDTSGSVSAADVSAVKSRGNQPPQVNAGMAQSVTLPASAALAGTAIDDGEPVPPGALAVGWSTVSGPGSVTFGTPGALSTSASFTQSGTYVLRLTASDGQLSASADITVTVAPGPAATASVSGIASPIPAGTAGTLTVTLRDANGNVATGYRGTVHFTSSDAGAGLPADYTFTAGDNGSRAFAVTFNTVGTQSVTVTDTGNGALNASQGGISVIAAAMPGLFEKPLPWNKDVSALPVSPRSAAIIAALTNLGAWNRGTPGSPDNKLQVDFSLSILTANGATPRRTVTSATTPYCYGGPDCDPVPLQMPAPVNGNTEGSADYACDFLNGDCHILVVETQEKKLYELFNASSSGGNFVARGAFVWDLTKQYGEVLRGDQCTSADAAGLPIAALLPTSDEVAAGEVPHALRFILRNEKMKRGAFPNGVFVRPATHAGGPSNTTNPDAPPYGVRLRLKASFDETPYSAGARVILRALKKYGMILSDGGNIPLTFADDRYSTNKWVALGITPHSFVNMPPSVFDVVDLGPEIQNTFNCVRAP